VVDEDDLLGAEQVLGDGKAAQRVVAQPDQCFRGERIAYGGLEPRPDARGRRVGELLRRDREAQRGEAFRGRGLGREAARSVLRDERGERVVARGQRVGCGVERAAQRGSFGISP